MPTIEVNGNRLGYDVQGSGAPLVFLPGLGLPRTMWQPQVEYFSGTYQVITYESRGAGESGRLEESRNLLSRQAADLAGFVQNLGIGKAVVCGVSYGGVLAQRFALDYPELVAGLVISDSFSDTRPRSFGEFGRILLLYLAGWAWLLPAGALLPGIRKTYREWPLALQHMEPGVRRLRKWETTKLRYALNGINYGGELSRIECPTLGIVGSTSPPLVTYMERLTAAIPGARLERIADSFDPSNLCRPDEFNRVLATFLKEMNWGR